MDKVQAAGAGYGTTPQFYVTQERERRKTIAGVGVGKSPFCLKRVAIEWEK